MYQVVEYDADRSEVKRTSKPDQFRATQLATKRQQELRGKRSTSQVRMIAVIDKSGDTIRRYDV